MNRDKKDIILESAALLREWETAPDSWSDPYSDMSDIEKSKLLYLLSQLHESDQRKLEETQGQMAEVLKNSRETTRLLNESLSQIAALQKQLAEMMRKLDQKDKIISDLREELQLYKGQKYNRTSQKGKRKNTKNEASHQQSKDDFDGTEESLTTSKTDADVRGSEVQTDSHESADAIRRFRGPRGPYDVMDASESVTHRSDESKLPSGSVVLGHDRKTTFDQECHIVKHVYDIIKYKTPDGKIHRGYFPANDEPVLIDEVPGTHASANLMAYTVFNRYVLDTPNYRERERFLAEQMHVSRSTLGNWLKKGSLYVQKVVDILFDQALERDSIVNCDETWCRVKSDLTYKKKYIWCLVNKASKIVVYKYENGSRGRKVLKNMLEGHEIKALQSDGYNVYMYLDGELSDIDHLCCMAHARAKFQYAYEQSQDEDAKFMLEQIGALYGLEAEYEKGKLSPEQIYACRNSLKTMEIKISMRSKLNQLKASSPPNRGELMQKAINYFDNFWNQLFAYQRDGNYTIDNSIAERNIRPLAGERKNSLFFGSHIMAQVSAYYHTLISTCRAQGYSALNYFKLFFSEIVKGRNDYENLLPQTIGIANNKY